MKFLSNIHNPDDEYASAYVTRSFHETQEEAWQHHIEWLKGKVITRPKATDKYTIEELEAMGMVGVYDPTRENDDEGVR